MDREAVGVLLIDDDENDAFLFQRIFSKCDWPVSVSHVTDVVGIYDDVEILRQLGPHGTQSPDFIFLDINMPKVNGLVLLNSLKMHERFRMIPVVIFTTSDLQEHIDQAYAIGATAYIVKPNSVLAYQQLVGAFTQFWAGMVRRPRIM